MKTKRYTLLTPCILLACAVASGAALAKPEGDACIELGALAYNDWTHPDAGGSGLPAGEPNVEYLRCKSCHGWDRLGINGGYVRRERTADQPNAGLGDTNTTSRDISVGRGNYYEIDVEDILHTGTGRAYEDGSGSWVELGANPTNEQVIAYVAGYTLGNLHPDFSTTGVNGDDVLPTQDQLECLVDFINFADADPKFYFQAIYEERDPVEYEINNGASTTAGETFYDDNCLRCHGEPHQNANGVLPDGGLVTYLRQDGAYSEFVHHARWGIPGTMMTRAAIGTPNSQNMIDLMLYLQNYVAENTEFTVTGGISGTWWAGDSRDGEGFVLDVAPDGDGWTMVASYYTYDGFGSQAWLIGAGPAVGDTVTTVMEITSGGIFGENYNPLTVLKTEWGTLEFTFSSCWTGHVKATPDPLSAVLGFYPVEFDIERLTPPGDCP
jgi:cytochrome c2